MSYLMASVFRVSTFVWGCSKERVGLQQGSGGVGHVEIMDVWFGEAFPSRLPSGIGVSSGGPKWTENGIWRVD